MSQSKLNNAKSIVGKDSIQEIENGESYIVRGSVRKGVESLYEVTRVSGKQGVDPRADFYCKNITKDEACMGWKFASDRRCKHILAVMLYMGADETELL